LCPSQSALEDARKITIYGGDRTARITFSAHCWPDCPLLTTSADITLEAVSSIRQIAADDWNACANPDGSVYNPFLSYAFFAALEESGSATARTGWLARHLVARCEDHVLGIVPCYLKNHSQGEYVFDHNWAEAFMRAGGAYYPKLQVSVPFTPVTGPRLLVRTDPDREPIREALIAGMTGLCNQLGVSSVHVTFAAQDDWELLAQHGFLQRTDQQYHWRNESYESFDDFLATLASRHRKAIKRERREALANGIEIEVLTGAKITDEAWDAFYNFYMETGSRKWGRPYLTRDFYTRIAQTMADDIVLIMAKREGQWIAGAINFVGSDTLYGRHWGAIEQHPFLHFEVCYYQAIDYAIARGLKSVEAGAQGEHKIARGYLPQTTHSAHYIADPALRRAVRDYLVHERDYVAEVGRELTQAGPFRKQT
jgi:predicted N-acyltransferase